MTAGFPTGHPLGGVGHQYCGQVGKVTNCQTGVFLAYVSSRGRARWTRGCICLATGSPIPALPGLRGARGVARQSKPELGRQVLQAARERGQLAGQWVTADEAYGQIPSFRDALDDDGGGTSWRSPTTPVFTVAAVTAIPPAPGAGAPRPTAGSLPGSRRPARWTPWWWAGPDGLAAAHGGGRRPRAPHLRVRRPAGLGEPGRLAGAGLLGTVAPGPWTARTQTLPLQCAGRPPWPPWRVASWR